ncbi:MFS transporter [Thauera sp. Sel9]|uniref:MFS transporter n=1 Tax=Thauera sp. Sel9 TaxID=2974299 RepID=UPI0021E1AA1E|nr:MFS transporter [Thauera sp. Sel9]MCV2215895.1 MFS transporter [Thauera sp. Sel9]
MSNAAAPGAWSRIFLPFALGYYLSYLLRTVNAVISPALTGELELSAAQLGLLTSMYFFAFGLAQIPVGIALDRYGPRRVESALLLLTALGAALFAQGDSIGSLGLGRALIGLGVSACLMGALKGFALWYPPERQSSMTGYVMACGALGALTASVPLEAMIPLLGWRGVFWGIAAVALAASANLFYSLPRETAAGGNVRLASIVQGVAGIFAAPAFLRFAGSSLFFVGGFMALQSLWAVPWLMHVEGLELAAAARILLVMNLGMLSGQLSIGMFGVRLARLGVQPLRLLQVGYAGLLLVLAAILFGVGPVIVMWFLFGVLSAVNSQSYLAAANNFPREMFGRVSTSINLMVFLGAFLVQWGIGLVLDLLRSWGWAMPEALKFALAVLLLLQAFSYLPLLGRRAGKSGN